MYLNDIIHSEKEFITMGVCREGQNGHLPLLEIRTKSQNFSRKPDVSSFVSIISLTAYLRHHK